MLAAAALLVGCSGSTERASEPASVSVSTSVPLTSTVSTSVTTTQAPVSVADPPTSLLANGFASLAAPFRRVLPVEGTSDRTPLGSGVRLATGPAGLLAIAPPVGMGVAPWAGLLGWISADGRAWEGVPSLRSLSAPPVVGLVDRTWFLTDLAANDEQYLIALESGPCTASVSAIATSRNGRTWSYAPTNLPSAILTSRIVATNKGFLAAITPCLNGPRRPADIAQIWSSIDGVAWDKVLDLPATVETVSIAADGDTAAVLGSSWPSANDRTQLWLTRGITSTCPRHRAVSCTWLSTATNSLDRAGASPSDALTTE